MLGVIESIVKYGIERSVEEIKEDLEVMGISDDNFPLTFNLFPISKKAKVLVPQDIEDSKLPEMGINPDSTFAFDSNREGKVWDLAEGLLLWTSSDGHAEEGYILFY